MSKLFYNKIGFIALVKREINRFFKVYIQTIIAPLLSNLLFLGVFGGMLSTRKVGIEGVDYLSFLVPGLAGMGALFAGFQNPAFSLISQKYQNTIDDLNSFPMSNFEKTLAFITGGTIRGVLIGVVTYISTIFFVGYRVENPVLFLLLLIVISFIFASIGLVCGLYLENFEKMNFILSIVLTPLAYFGGVFFEVSKLPTLLSKLVYLNPLYPLINLLRYSYLGEYEGNIVIQSIYIVVILCSSFYLALRTFSRGVGLKK